MPCSDAATLCMAHMHSMYGYDYMWWLRTQYFG